MSTEKIEVGMPRLKHATKGTGLLARVDLVRSMVVVGVWGGIPLGKSKMSPLDWGSSDTSAWKEQASIL